MKIAFFETDEHEREVLAKGLKTHILQFEKNPLEKENLKKARDCEILSVETGSTVSKQILDELPNLKMIAARCTGYDKIDLEECKKRAIIVSNVPAYSEHSVAEHTFALLLSISRNITKAYNRVHHDDFSIQGLQGFDLNGKTIGVIGTGHIGMHVIQMARSFCMNTLAFSKTRDEKIAKKFGFRWASLNELLAKSDIITLHIPLTPQTKHIINESTIKKMKDGAVIINTARGGLIDTRALIKALNSGKVKAVGLDVLEGEELMKYQTGKKHLDVKSFKQLAVDHKLLNKENVIFTPHIAFSSAESEKNLLESSIQNIQSFIKGQAQNQVRTK
jgi:D-lactate dehydrogenase